jgi:protein-disulfide isomerase
LTCSHCAVFSSTILPELEKRYVDKGKVRFILHDFPIDGISLKAAAIARCMPADQYFPFVKTLFKSLATWAASTGNPENNLIQYAKLGGLPEEKAKACLNDTALLDAIIAERTEAGEKYKVEATPTFIINDGAEVIRGAESVETFAAAFDRLLAAKK